MARTYRRPLMLPLLLLLSCALLRSQTMAAPAIAQSETTPDTAHRYPYNLHRLYDGTWETTSLPPFTDIPNSSDTSQSHNATQPSPLARPTTTILQSTSRTSALSFQKKSGFALLTIDNHPIDLDTSLNIVFGDFIIRDGQYRTPRDVSYHLVGVYDLDTGTLVVIGDVFYQDSPVSLLPQLYEEFIHARPPTSPTVPAFNKTSNEFVTAFTAPLNHHLSSFGAQRVDNQQEKVAERCPFSAAFQIREGQYYDTPPTSTLPISQLVPRDQSNGGRGSMSSSSVFSGNEAHEAAHAQEQFVELSGSFQGKTCNTEMTVLLATMDTRTLFGKAINYTLLVTVVAFIQVVVLIRQMEMTSTQAGARRVSLMTVGLQAVADSYLCLGHLTMGIAVQTLFNAFATAAFFKFICFSIFLMRWMLLIWKARRPSGFSEGWEAMRRELSMLYSRFYGSLLLGIFLLYQMQDHARLFVFALYSFWVPQIILNVVEDHRRPLWPGYILGTSITRLGIPLYFWGCPKNFLHIQPQATTAIALVGWMALQTMMLLSQYKFGPRWFIPKQFLPEKYDYFRPVTVSDDGTEEEAMEEGESTPILNGEGREIRDVKRECCICMESVSIHSRDRMVTPCNHFFHAACLERWLEVRLECALCRSPVPPP